MRSLIQSEVESYIYNNKYSPNIDSIFRSRCIDGRYPNSIETPALAVPGADTGALAFLYAAANTCGFQVDPDRSFAALNKIIGGVKNFSFHTDSRSYKLGETGCGHIKCMTNSQEAYSLTDVDMQVLNRQLEFARQNGATETILQGDHQEAAVLQIKGKWGVQPQGYFESERGPLGIQVFVFHSSLVDSRNKEWARLLVENKAVELPDGLDEEYLYQMISSTAEDHLMETAGKLAKGLPMFEVVFDESGNFSVESLGNI